jgi:HEPN domain-containing protein
VSEITVRQWLRKAENDRKIARRELARPDAITDAVCFHAQQHCEKYLKAFLIYHGAEYPKTQDLSWLIELCARIDDRFHILHEWHVHRLTRYATVARYDVVFFPSLEEAQAATDLAEKASDFVRQRLREKGFVIEETTERSETE